nr:MAG TPA_asm: hypothetical protein [Bacteriophage sp.]
MSTKFSTLKCHSENRSRKAGCYTCLICICLFGLPVIIICFFAVVLKIS